MCIRCNLVVTLIALAAVGCSTSDSLLPAGGTVSYDGKPLDTGMVVFMPVESGRPAEGKVQSDGSFRLATDGVSGVLPGQYKAMVRPSTAPSEGDRTADKLPIPPRYMSHTSSGLEFEVDAQGENQFTIQIPNG